jgi:Holliday junction resolvase RusA-like endonuclease
MAHRRGRRRGAAAAGAQAQALGSEAAQVNAIRVVVGGSPVGKQRPRLGKGGHVYTPARTRRYERTVKWSALGARPRSWSLSGVYRVDAEAWFPDARRRDGDNVLKSVLDGMIGVLYEDDSQVVVAVVSKGIDRENPRTVIVVEELPRARAAG